MIKILNRVEFQEELIQHQCTKCTSLLELKPSTDTVFRQDQYEGNYRDFNCPVCSTKQYLWKI